MGWDGFTSSFRNWRQKPFQMRPSLTSLSVSLPLDVGLDGLGFEDVHNGADLLSISGAVSPECAYAWQVCPIGRFANIPVHGPVAIEVCAKTDCLYSLLNILLPVTVVLLCFGHAYNQVVSGGRWLRIAGFHASVLSNMGKMLRCYWFATYRPD